MSIGFETMIRFIYSGNQTAITNITNLDLLFEICRLADKVTIYILLGGRGAPSFDFSCYEI
jgi:hypothetical protein